MDLVVAGTFRSAFEKLASDEQVVAKGATGDLFLNPAKPSFQLHRVHGRETDLCPA